MKQYLNLLESVIANYNYHSYLHLQYLSKKMFVSAATSYGFKQQAKNDIDELAKILGVKVKCETKIMEHDNENCTKKYFQAKIIYD